MVAYRPLEPQWHRDPFGRHELRFWDGIAWTERVADNGVEGVDPVPPTGAPQPTFVQPTEAEPAVEPSPPPLPSEPAAAQPGGPFNFDDAELDYEPPKAVGLEQLDGAKKGVGKLLAAGALLLVVIVAGFLVLGSGDDDADSEIAGEANEGSSETSQVDGFPSASEQNVIDRLPGGFRCQRAADDRAVGSAEGTVDCSADQTAPVEILASSFADRSASDSYVDQLVADAQVEYVPSGDCTGATTGLWTGGDFSGRVACFEGSDGPMLAWTVGAEPIVNVATATDAVELSEWWQTSAVPGPVRILQPFPTPREAEALQQVPAELATTCTRFIGQPTEGSVGSLECRPANDADTDSAIVDVVYLDVFEADFDIDAFYNAFDLPRADKGGCRVGVPGNNSYSVGEETIGRVACYVNEGRTWMHWYDSRTQLVGQANFTDADVVEPYEWWTGNAVVGATEDRTFDRAESNVLESVPASLADSCVSEPVNAENDRWNAKLRCQPDADGVLSVTYFNFQTQRRINNEFTTRRGEIEADTGTCAASGVPAEGPWESAENSGREICEVRQGVAEIFSANFDDKVAVLVAAENDDIDRLVAWLNENR